ncbi:hypothetical protein F5Y00DRAFT_225082 [Daldinia vernicosa]|uniref:uncharacterized protein n=1 Tax=Daldinia vernicosa TaxID=114800 RepID=UPI0020072C1A|nr:uncharacterized protein F5Y00DRAFT_225082 [Daldinia vernicosa]KAI0853624.1 hypothetical protein F5Y00DRAFT_225082 [Daldinia vernicosa]
MSKNRTPMMTFPIFSFFVGFSLRTLGIMHAFLGAMFLFFRSTIPSFMHYASSSHFHSLRTSFFTHLNAFKWKTFTSLNVVIESLELQCCCKTTAQTD